MINGAKWAELLKGILDDSGSTPSLSWGFALNLVNKDYPNYWWGF